MNKSKKTKKTNTNETDDEWDVVGTVYRSDSDEENSNGSNAEAKGKTGKSKKNKTTKKPQTNYLPTSTDKKTIYITKSGAFVKYETLQNNAKIIKKIENYFTLRTKVITGQLKQLKCCKSDKIKKRLIVPRFGVFEILHEMYGLNNYKTISQIAVGNSPENKFIWKGKLNENQKVIASHISKNYFTKKHVDAGSAGVILNLEAGQGKSYLAAYLISVIGKKSAIIMHSTSLLEQWAKVLRICFGSDISIGYYYGKKKKDGDIMLMIIDSATSNEFKFEDTDRNEITMTPMEFYNQFGFVVYDECHTYSNKYSQRALKIAHAPYMLGLSATPDENSYGFDPAVWWELGPVLDAKTVAGYESKSEDFSAAIHRIMYYGPKKYTRQITNEYTEMTSNSETINMICEDDIRSHIIVDCIMEGLLLGLNMFVFADRREYLSQLKDLLQEMSAINGEILDNEKDFVRIVGGAKNDELEKAEITSRVIFTTYQYMGTGKSIIKMNGLVLATPRKSKMKQYINRIFRLGSDASIERHIWDICDMKLKLSNQWATRNAYFKEKGYKIKPKKIKYDEYQESAPVILQLTAEEANAEIETAEEAAKQETVKPKPKAATKTAKKPITRTNKKANFDTTEINNIVSKMMARLRSDDE